jgi:hypothetical protein
MNVDTVAPLLGLTPMFVPFAEAQRLLSIDLSDDDTDVDIPSAPRREHRYL